MTTQKIYAERPKVVPQYSHTNKVAPSRQAAVEENENDKREQRQQQHGY